MDIALTVLTFFIILLILVLIHEFGHFIAAKKSGVLVEEFGFGFPPRLFGKKLGETLYSFNLIPLGGFVKLYQEEYHEEDTVEKNQNVPANRGFINKKSWQKVVIICGGVIMNFILGWMILSYLLTRGVPSPTGIAVEQIQPQSPAAQAGLKKGDQLLKIGNKNLVSTYELIQASKDYSEKSVTLVFKRNGLEKSVSVTPRSNPPQGQGAIGVIIKQLVEIKKYPWYKAPFYGLQQSVQMIHQIATEILKIPLQLITQKKTNVEFSGPVGIATVVDQARKFGLNALLELTALLSLNLAVFNILPFPALDGGRLIFIIYEWITGKRSNQKLEKYMNLIGIIILLSLSALVTINDIRKLWG